MLIFQGLRQLGDDCPKIDNAEQFVRAFNATQYSIAQSLVTAGHDISDGGLITTVLEMAFGGKL